MFQKLPVDPDSLPFLPVEIWATILRLLDYESLLAAAQSFKLWTAVCRGDPFLKHKLTFIMQVKTLYASKSTDPWSLTSTSSYGTNVSEVAVSNPIQSRVKPMKLKILPRRKCRDKSWPTSDCFVSLCRKMFQILPVESDSLPFLPVEIWSTILRLLEPPSLLAAARSFKLWMAVCRGDPILKHKLRYAIEEETQLARSLFMQPRMLTRVLRSTSARNYGTNVSKVIVSNPKQTVMVVPSCNANVHASRSMKMKILSQWKCRNKSWPYRL